MSDRVIIFDTTLRDGEQSPGCSMNAAEKLEIAALLVDLGVDVIEAGFPIASPGDFEAVQAIARQFGDRGPKICGLARCREEDIDRAGNALREAKNNRIHVFLATSSIHRQYKLKMDKAEIVQKAIESVQRAKGFCEDVEFSPEDAARTELDFLCEVVEKAISAGATTVNIPDTVGYATPSQYFNVIRHLKKNVPNIDQAIISTHCHNDLGLAVANTLAGLEAGARQVECTLNGLGERAGNAALEEIVMALRTRQDYYNLTTGINTRKLCAASRLVSSITGMIVQRNKAIVGQNAFAHEAGIHQHGMLQERTTYEIMRPEDVGFTGSNLVLGKHSGRHAFRDRIEHLGHHLDEKTFEKVFDDFIVLCDKKKSVYDADIIALVENRSTETPDRWKLASLHTSAGTGSIPTATIELVEDGKPAERDAAIGDGPVDAVFNALERITGISARLQNYQVRSLTGGKEAQGEALVEIVHNNHVFHGKATSTDIIEASAQAYLKALNKASANQHTQKPIHAQHE